MSITETVYRVLYKHARNCNMWNRRTRLSSRGAKDRKIKHNFGRIKLSSISVILYSTDSFKQLPCNAMLMTHTIVL